MTKEALKLSAPFRLGLGATVLLGAAAAVSLCPRAGLAAVEGSAVAPIAEGGNFDLNPEVVGECKVGQECVVKLTATTKGEFHVNESYPFKLTLAAAGVEFHGSGGATFVGGDFERRGRTVAVMTVKFKPSAKGPITLTGKYKVCFCTDKECAPSTIDVSIPVNVK
jgi:hypothetical protein